MNLIEQLGYEKAKNIHCGNAGDWSFYSISFDWYSDKFHEGHGMVNIEDIESELLDYRRQHNIFEVGDLVVMVDADDYSTIFKVIGKPQRLYHLQGNDDLFYGRLDFQIRHATNAEIKAGKRLEVGNEKQG